MSAHSGPDINNAELVFAYDMNNNKKSWKGAPITNLAIGRTSIGNNNVPTTTVITTKPDGKIGEVQEHSAETISDVNRTVSIGSWSLTSDMIYTLSFYVKNLSCSGFNGNLYSPTSNVLGGITYPTIFTDRWTRVTRTFTVPSGFGSAYVFSPQLFRDGGLGKFRLTDVQLEQNGFATPYINGTRSNTQTLLDLTSNNTVAASSLTYNSNGTFSFNGTSDEIHPPINHSYLSSSALEVIFRSTSHGTGFKTIFGYRHNVGYGSPTIGSLYLNGNTLNAAVITASQVYRIATASVTIDTNVYYHVVLNKNTTTGLLEIYVNGVLSGSQTFDAATYGQWTTAGSYIGENFLDIGKSTNTSAGQGWSTDYFSGIIPMARVYNRTLTAAEVEQHYKASRGRYSQYQTMTYTATSNVTLTNNGTQEVNMFKTADDGGWNGEVRSTETFTAPCTIEFSKQAGVTNNGASHAMIGWNEDPITNTSYTSMDYASYPYATGSYSVYNNGSQVHSSGVWDVNKRFYIVYDTDGYIRHYNDSTLLYSANYGTNKIVCVDSSYYAVNSTFGGFTKVKVIRASWNGTNYV